IALILFSIWGFRAPKNQRAALRIPLRILAAAILTASSSMLALYILAMCIMDSHSALVFSPDRHYAARVENIDGGATDGDSSVVVFSLWGLKRDFVLQGREGDVNRQSLHWEDNGKLLIYFDGDGGNFPNCKSTTSIEVRCAPTPVGQAVQTTN